MVGSGREQMREAGCHRKAGRQAGRWHKAPSGSSAGAGTTGRLLHRRQPRSGAPPRLCLVTLRPLTTGWEPRAAKAHPWWDVGVIRLPGEVPDDSARHRCSSDREGKGGGAGRVWGVKQVPAALPGCAGPAVTSHAAKTQPVLNDHFAGCYERQDKALSAAADGRG